MKVCFFTRNLDWGGWGAKAGSWSLLIGPLIIASRSIGECSEYNTGEANVGAVESPFPLQSPL